MTLLTLIAANETIKPRTGPRNAPHIALKRHDGIGRKMSEAKTAKSIAARMKVLSPFSQMRTFIQLLMLSSKIKKGMRTIVMRIAHIAVGFKFLAFFIRVESDAGKYIINLNDSDGYRVQNMIKSHLMTLKEISEVDKLLKKEFQAHSAPIIELIKAQTDDPFCVLVGTILSSRTKDACTTGAVKRLFATAQNGMFKPSDLERLSEKEIEKLIYPVGFYHVKAKHLKALPAVLNEKFAGKVPDTVEELCELPGVGRKTANLTVAVGFDLPAICVDVHVHRICNNLRIVETKTPFETEMKLREVLPVEYWKTWNSHLVSFGQTRCDPVRPKCDGCPIKKFCRSPKKK